MKKGMIKSRRNCPLCNEGNGRYFFEVNGVNILRCASCGMAYADVNNSDIFDENINYSEAAFYGYLQKEPIHTFVYYNKILDRLSHFFDKEDFEVLDFGCGNGFFLHAAKEYGVKATGVDLSPYVELANKYFGVNAIKANVLDNPFGGKKFDAVFSHATYEHLGDFNAITRMLVENLKPGGVFIISGIPNFNSIAIQVFRNFYQNWPPSHVNFFEKHSVKQLFEKHGLKSYNIQTYGLDVMVWYLMRKLKGDKKKNNINKSKIENLNNKTGSHVEEQKSINFIKKIKKHHRFITNLYLNFNLPYMGKSIEAWGVKK